MRCHDARCRPKCRKIADWERRHASELARYEPSRNSNDTILLEQILAALNRIEELLLKSGSK
jgi:hypothetical protein